MTRSKRVAAVAVAALAMAVPASAQAADYTVTKAAPASWSGTGATGLNVTNAFYCPNNTAPVTVCDGYHVKAGEAGTIRFEMTPNDGLADYDLYVYRGTAYEDADGNANPKVDGETGKGPGEAEFVETPAAAGADFWVEVVYFTSAEPLGHNYAANVTLR